MMKTRFAFVTATAKKKGTMLPIQQTLQRMNTADFDIEVQTFVEYENRDGLTTVYNRFLDAHKDFDFVVFLHDDLWINDVLFFDKVMDAHKRNGFDVIGVCGGKQWLLDNPAKPNIWTVATKNAGASGFMIHAPDLTVVKSPYTYEGRAYFASNYGISPQRTLTLDGSIICFSRRAVEAGLRWDEQFQFHFYDMDICISAVKEHGLAVGTAPFIATHQSLGQSVSQPEFMRAQQKFIDKWRNR